MKNKAWMLIVLVLSMIVITGCNLEQNPVVVPGNVINTTNKINNTAVANITSAPVIRNVTAVANLTAVQKCILQQKMLNKTLNETVKICNITLPKK
jgi:uncharacterized lipoprotein YajG